jgi:c-di-GMP-binding flagellar brake protein YcgR
MQERRQHPRVPMSRTATVRIADGQPQRVQLVDLSISGLGLHLPHAANSGDAIAINFHLSHAGQSMFIDVQGIIRRSHIRGTEHVVGVELQHISPEATKLISDFVRYKLEIGGHLRPGAGNTTVQAG